MATDDPNQEQGPSSGNPPQDTPQPTHESYGSSEHPYGEPQTPFTSPPQNPYEAPPQNPYGAPQIPYRPPRRILMPHRHMLIPVIRGDLVMRHRNQHHCH